MKAYYHKITELQKRLPQDGETILKLIEALYPDLEIDWNIERGKIKAVAHANYTWVMISYKNLVDFGVENHSAMIGDRIVFGKRSIDEYRKMRFPFRIIPFIGKCNEGVTEARKTRCAKILSEAGYKKPSQQEWWNEYNTD